MRLYCRFAGVLTFQYDAKGIGILLSRSSVGTREAFGRKADSFFVSGPRVQPVGQRKTARASCWSDPRVIRFSRVVTRPDREICKHLLIRPDPTRLVRFENF